MIFVTLNTGHSQEWPMNRLSPVAHTHCLGWLKDAVRKPGPSPVPELGLNAQIKLTRHPGGHTADSAMLILMRGPHAAIIYALCLHSVRAGQNWEAIIHAARTFGIEPLGDMPASTPWLAAALFAPAAALSPDVLAMCADWAACMSTILIEKENAGEITP